MMSTRAHLTPEEIAAYASHSLDFHAEHEIDDHAAACDRCHSVLINALWDRLERNTAGPDAGSPPGRTAVWAF
jgi:hypothetical protein